MPLCSQVKKGFKFYFIKNRNIFPSLHYYLYNHIIIIYKFYFKVSVECRDAGKSKNFFFFCLGIRKNKTISRNCNV